MRKPDFQRRVVNENGQSVYRDYYVYTVKLASIASGATQSAIINIEADSNFVWEKTSYFADIAGAAQSDSSRVIPLINMSVNDSGSGRNLQNESTALGGIAGDGRLPYVLPKPRTFKANSTINFTFENFDAAATYRLQVSLVGYKEFIIG